MGSRTKERSWVVQRHLWEVVVGLSGVGLDRSLLAVRLLEATERVVLAAAEERFQWKNRRMSVVVYLVEGGQV